MVESSFHDTHKARSEDANEVSFLKWHRQEMTSLWVKAEPRQEMNAYVLICKNLWCTKLWGILLLQKRDSFSFEMTEQLTAGVAQLNI